MLELSARSASCGRHGALRSAICCIFTLGGLAAAQPAASPPVSPNGSAAAADRAGLADAQGLFYNAQYEAAASMTLALRASDAHDLASDELRSTALLFQLRGLLEGQRDKGKAIAQCAACPELMAAFLADVHHGQALAHSILRTGPNDAATLFFLGKLDLNYVWLQLGLLGKRTGWDEYWEARRSLDAVLKQNPRHVRARVARAWIDYIVNTKMPWGTRWLLGGGNKKRALAAVREAADTETDFFSHAEAQFALWDMHVRERDHVRATELARKLAHDFPGNREVAAYLVTRHASSH